MAMAFRFFSFVVLLLGCVCAAPANDAVESQSSAAVAPEPGQEKEDLKTAASSSIVKRSDWGGGYPGAYSGYSVTGYGSVDDRYNSNSGGYGGYDSSLSYGGYGGSYPGYTGYTGNAGYGGSRGYGASGYGSGGYGGYGGYGGNGGLNSYYGYNYPSYQGASHTGYGYYNRRPGYGNIYGNGITPSLVTGYRGYSRR